MKRISILVGLLAALLVIFLVVKSRDKATTSADRIENFLDIDTTRVTKIELSKLGSQVALSRIGDTWYVLGEESRKAEEGSIRQLLSSLGGLTVGAVISDNPENQMTFQVDTLMGSTVRVYQSGDLVSTLIVGKAAPNFGSTYVRKSGSNDVYLADGMFTHLFNRPANTWLDKSVNTITKDQVTRVDIKRSDSEFSLVKEDTLWMLSTGGSSEVADRSKVDSFLNRVCGLKADDFAAQADTADYSFEEVHVEVSIALTDGSSATIEGAVPKEDARRYFIRRAEDGTVFVVYSPTWTILTWDSSEFKVEQKNI